MLPSSETLARRLTAGDDGAFTDLYRRFAPRLRAYARSVVRDEHEAQDVVQTAMLRALSALRGGSGGGLGPAGAVEPWLFRIVRNTAIDVVRRRREHAPLSELADHPRLVAPSVADVVLRREAWRAVVADVRALPPKQQRALVEREIAGRDYPDVAARMDVTPLAARQSVFAARRRLRQRAVLRAAA